MQTSRHHIIWFLPWAVNVKEPHNRRAYKTRSVHGKDHVLTQCTWAIAPSIDVRGTEHSVSIFWPWYNRVLTINLTCTRKYKPYIPALNLFRKAEYQKSSHQSIWVDHSCNVWPQQLTPNGKLSCHHGKNSEICSEFLRSPLIYKVWMAGRFFWITLVSGTISVPRTFIPRLKAYPSSGRQWNQRHQ